MARKLQIDVHVDGAWHDAARLTIDDPPAGWSGASSIDYTLDHWLKFDPTMSGQVIGAAALSVRLPISQEWNRYTTWPPFLLDLLPQGHAREVLAESLKLDADTKAADTPLLLLAGGSPVGNLRIREAWDEEQARIRGLEPLALTDEQLFAKDEAFATLASDFTAVAPGSSDVQGAWPKMLLTRDRSGRWLPDSMVPDDQATEHIIAKWVGDDRERSRQILQAEAPYLELARGFGLRCGQSLTHRDGMLLIPRFDRRIESGRVIRCGQESIVSASGIAAFGHITSHEEYLDTLKWCCDDPAAEVTEYLLRDLLNLAAGNPDNHGRNTALANDVDGSVRLTPLFDFCPMRLNPQGIARSTRWACMRGAAGSRNDLNPDWEIVCEVAAKGGLDAADLRARIDEKADAVRALPETARTLGIADQVIEMAMGRCDELARAATWTPRTITHAGI